MKLVFGLHYPPHFRLLCSGLCALFLAACGGSQPAPTQAPAPETSDIGYGEVDEEHVMKAVSEVSIADVSESRTPTLIEMLSRHPGVRVFERPYGETTVHIRGSTSFQSDEEPLFVIDGMAIPRGTNLFMTLDPATIESITVLKDAGETAIYGSRGANGVILIKTKSR